MSDAPRRHVVLHPTQVSWTLEPMLDHGVPTGGARSMHELAVAIAATGRQVEVRGTFDHAELDRLTAATGTTVQRPSEPRPVGDRDVVLINDGHVDPLVLAPLLLSGAQIIMVLLAPPGRFGWPFTAGWRPPPVTATELHHVAQPEHFRAINAMGVRMWTHMPLVAELSAAADVPCSFIGNGRPVPYPTPAKRYDVAVLSGNRWADASREAAQALEPGIDWRELPPMSNDRLLEAVGEARVLIHAMGIEGHSRIGQEARGVGTVPVTLRSNPFAVGIDESSGAVAVERLSEIPGAIAALLGDPARLDALRRRGIESVQQQIDWDRYVARVDAALSREHDDPAGGARAELGRRLRDYHAQLAGERDAVARERDAVARERDAVAHERDAVTRQRDAIRATRAWRLACRWWRLRDQLRGTAGAPGRRRS